MFMTRQTLSRFCLLAVIALLLPALAGCSTTQKAWDRTTDIYDTYLDPKPEIDLDRRPGLSRKEQVLAVQFSLIDQHLESALRTLAPQDRFPSEAWFLNFQSQFPWMTSIMAVDTQGQMLAQYPEHPLKTIQTPPLLDHEWSMLHRGLQGFAQQTPLGPELIMAGPFFRDGIWQGLLVAHFDPRRLVEFATSPDRLVMLASGELLWSGVDQEAAQEMQDAPWDQLLRGNVHGQWSTQAHTFSWMARPIGNLRLIYAVALPN
ncbi:hypothetical protein SAMN05660653_00998 [Desulfonatronum thiosulfatophilum]|uniref:Uncharacterized protein n=2 Tax=Desulfonatronum thiosulfatophilum TaxID=617002 RepID=A0A1G6BJX3_9BACT|nr:hypothetical protein SAMN05660653_00998 [Desulfonatronum thiosulfatophilum]